MDATSERKILADVSNLIIGDPLFLISSQSSSLCRFTITSV